jgi:cytochrome P450
VNDAELAAHFDPFSPEVRADPNPQHKALRKHCPVHRFDAYKHPLYTVAKHGDVVTMLNDYQLWSSKHGQTAEYAAPERGLRTDPPEHTIFRKLLNPIFSKPRVRQMENRFRQVAQQLIDRFESRGEAEFCTHFAQPYPITVIADLLGVNAERQEDFRTWAAEYLAATAAGDVPREMKIRGVIYDYFSGKIAQRQAEHEANPGKLPDDIITLFVTSRHPEGRPFSDEELLPITLLLLLGGTDTTSLTIANCLRRLLEERRLWEQLVRDPSLAEAAIEESLRFDPPAVGIFRTNNTAALVGDVNIPAGSKCQASLASANRDEEVWEDPDVFRLDRDLGSLRRNQAAFGRGIHSCIGANFARVDARIALEVIASRLPALRIVGPLEFMEPYMMQGVTKLPVQWR